jgi:hypothetical protein
MHTSMIEGLFDELHKIAETGADLGISGAAKPSEMPGAAKASDMPGAGSPTATAAAAPTGGNPFGGTNPGPWAPGGGGGGLGGASAAGRMQSSAAGMNQASSAIGGGFQPGTAKSMSQSEALGL